MPDLTRPPPVVIPIRLLANSRGASADRLELALISAITTPGTPQDVTLQELRIESFLPADEATHQGIRGLAPEGPRPGAAHQVRPSCFRVER